jgi:ribonuclease D
MSPSLIEDRAALARLCARLEGQPWLALDTEFMRTNTYYARLCLVQVAVPGLVACIDPLVIGDITPLIELMYSPKILKVLHAARQDLEVFAQHLEQAAEVATDSPLYRLKASGAPPCPVFDTQIAAALVGYDDQIGYGTLVQAVTGRALEKLHTRADWAVRPLTPSLLRYAEDDVRYLCDVYEHLAQRLADLGRGEWLAEECAALTEPSLYRNDPPAAYRRLRAGESLPSEARAVLRELAAWRERTAQARNLPRGWVLPDEVLVEIARAAPQTLPGLAAVTGMNPARARKLGEEILAAVDRGRRAGPGPEWEEPRRLNREQSDLAARLTARARALAAEKGLSAALLAPRREIQKLVLGDAGSALRRGWRRQLLGEELLALCAAPPDAPAGARTAPRHG